jgi:diketogulonate reductase-like aldo/keto reductase
MGLSLGMTLIDTAESYGSERDYRINIIAAAISIGQQS